MVCRVSLALRKILRGAVGDAQQMNGRTYLKTPDSANLDELMDGRRPQLSQKACHS